MRLVTQSHFGIIFNERRNSFRSPNTVLSLVPEFLSDSRTDVLLTLYVTHLPMSGYVQI